VDIENKYLVGCMNYLNGQNENEYKMVYNFNGKIDFLNKILHNGYEDFCRRYKSRRRFV
jgi:hypothetical protein